MTRRTKVRTKNIEQLTQAWNNRNLHPILGMEPDYQVLELGFHSGRWRLEHPDDFPEFCFLDKMVSAEIYAYRNEHVSLPAEIIRMLVTGEIIFEELEAFITMLIRSWDKDVQVTENKTRELK